MRSPLYLQLRNDAPFDQRYARFTNIYVDDNNAASHSIQSGARISTRRCFGASFPEIDTHSMHPRALDKRALEKRRCDSKPPCSSFYSRHASSTFAQDLFSEASS